MTCRECNKPLSDSERARGRMCWSCLAHIRREKAYYESRMISLEEAIEIARRAQAEFRELYGAVAVTVGPARFWR